MNNTKIIIIGAGLSGWMIAYLLQKKGIDVLILEANTQLVDG
jgi:monoamine oxidase